MECRRCCPLHVHTPRQSPSLHSSRLPTDSIHTHPCPPHRHLCCQHLLSSRIRHERSGPSVESTLVLDQKLWTACQRQSARLLHASKGGICSHRMLMVRYAVLTHPVSESRCLPLISVPSSWSILFCPSFPSARPAKSVTPNSPSTRRNPRPRPKTHLTKPGRCLTSNL